jgi:putative alpha-1,2-mannosidase
MFAHAGCPLEGQRWLQHTLRTLYGPDGFAGDEDNGEMSAWYVLSSLGLFTLAPGSGSYQLGTAPLFRSVTIRRPAVLESGRKAGTLTVRRDEALPLVADARKQDFEPARKARWTRPHGKEQLFDLAAGAVHIPYKELLEGGELVFL